MFKFRHMCLALTAAVLAVPAAAQAAAPTYYLSPSGSDANACTQAAPCKSFSRGYAVASPGSEVVLAAGNYGGQSLSNLPAKLTSEKVVFHPASGASVSTGSLTISNSDNIEVRDVKTAGWGVTNGSAHIILRRVFAGDVSYAAGYFSGSDDVQLIDSEIARVDPDDGIHMNNGGGSNTNIVIDGLYEHDLTINRDSSSHDDCIQTGDVTNLVIRNSRFVNCGTQGVFLNPYNGGVTKNVTIENNFFGTAQLGYNILYIGDAQGVTVRNNSFVGQVYSYNSASFTSLKMTNNIFAGNDSYNCGQLATKSVSFSNNASTTSCSGAANHVVNSSLASQFVSTSPSSFDLHLKAGAAAIDKGTMTNGATVDFDDTARPVGGAADIGADEYGTGTTTPPVTTPPADTTAPATTISSAPSGSTQATTASIAFTGSDDTTAAGSLAFECSLDGGAWVACTSPKAYSGLAVGTHTVSVRAKDAAGNVDASPATASWTVVAPAPTTPPADTTAPTTTITSAPSGSTTATSASIAFGGSDDATAAGSLSFDCQLDGGAFTACASPKAYSGLAAGTHTVAVRAKDAAGNVDASPATASWTITTTTTTPSGPVAAYSFNETSGTTAKDATGNGLTGTISGATHTTSGKLGGALSFNGTSNQVSVADNAKLDLTTGMTLEAWVRPSSVSNWRSVLVKERDSSSLSYGLYANSSSNRPEGWLYANGAERSVRGTSTLPLNTWSHVAATFDGTTLRVYLNGTQVGSQAVSGSIAASGGALRIGGNKAWGEWFKGVMDEVRIYNRALTQTQIKADMTKAI